PATSLSQMYTLSLHDALPICSSKIKKFAPCSIILENMQRIFSPPDSTEHFFRTSSPEKSIFPKKPRINCSSASGLLLYSLSHSTRFSSRPSKKRELSIGKSATVMVIPHLYLPSKSLSLPVMIS